MAPGEVERDISRPIFYDFDVKMRIEFVDGIDLIPIDKIERCVFCRRSEPCIYVDCVMK